MVKLLWKEEISTRVMKKELLQDFTTNVKKSKKIKGLHDCSSS